MALISWRLPDDAGGITCMNSIFQDLVRKQVVQMTSGSVTKVVLESEANMKRPEYPKPDTSQMFPFKPKILLGKISKLIF